MTRAVTQQNVEEIPSWATPEYRAEAEALLAVQPNEECRAIVMNTLFSYGCNSEGSGDTWRYWYTPLREAPPRANIERDGYDGWHRRAYIIAGEDAGTQLTTRCLGFGRQQSYPATRCWSEKVFRQSVDLCEEDASSGHPVIVSASHHAVHGYWDVYPRYEDIRAWTYEDRVKWMGRVVEQLPSLLASALEWTKAILLMDPVYYDTGLLLWLKLRCLDVETPFAGLSRPDKLKWINKRRTELL